MQALSNSVPEKSSTAMLSGMAWHENLVALLKERNWSVPDLARQMGAGEDRALIDRLYKYTSGEVDNPRGQAMEQMARALGVTEIQLRTGRNGAAAAVETNFRPPPEILGARDLPVYAAVEGGRGQMVVSTDPIELVPRPWYMREVRDGYAVLVVGDSMEPAFEPGQMAIVNPRLPPMRDADVILVAGENEGEFTASIKRLINWTAQEWRVRQFNPERKFSLSRREWPKALRVVGKYYGG